MLDYLLLGSAVQRRLKIEASSGNSCVALMVSGIFRKEASDK